MSAQELDPSQGQPGRLVDISSGAGAGEAVPETSNSSGGFRGGDGFFGFGARRLAR